MRQYTDLLEILQNIDPSILNYSEWVNVGMALKQEGYGVEVWDAWSRRDAGRYHLHECERKWRSFRGDSQPVTGGTLVQMAMDQGWRPPASSRDMGYALEWDAEISDDRVVIDKNWLEKRELEEPGDEWDPVQDLTRYIETLFKPEEYVGYVTKSWEKDGSKKPSRGLWDRTAQKLLQELERCKGDIGRVFGDYDEEAGAWIRFNPLDGKGCKDENVTDFRYVLVESDDMDLADQNAMLRKLELPIAAMVYSGGKSLHAIVKVEAKDYQEYYKRVNYLFDVCKKNGLSMDHQNRNPSRLSRMPGVTRKGHKQYLVDTDIGKGSWQEWEEWIESVNDNLPDPENLGDLLENLPELSPCLIEGVLRQGHKMLLAGPSKAGKSFLQIELCIAIAENLKWLGWQCARGRVLYVNLELDRASCLHRFADVYRAMRIQPEHVANIDVWNLRGKSVPMDKLAPKLIRRALKKNYIAVVIDPIYKVITGDENSADQMANFCNQFDKICTELGSAVIYCHHHSKGTQGMKRSMDRASGSGVFARDPDALLDLIELEIPRDMQKQEENKALCEACLAWLREARIAWEEDLSQDDECSSKVMVEYCRRKAGEARLGGLEASLASARRRAENLSAWRVEGTLREFPKFAPVNLWFDYPLHRLDQSGALKDVEPEREKPAWESARENRARQAERIKEQKFNQFEVEFANIEMEGREVPAQELADKLGVDSKTMLSWLGGGRRRIPDLAKNFEKYGVSGKEVYVRRIPEKTLRQT